MRICQLEGKHEGKLDAFGTPSFWFCNFDKNVDEKGICPIVGSNCGQTSKMLEGNQNDGVPKRWSSPSFSFKYEGKLLRFPSSWELHRAILVLLFTFPSSSCHVGTKEIPRRNEGNLASERNLHRDARRYWFPGAYSTVNDGVLNFILISRSSLI